MIRCPEFEAWVSKRSEHDGYTVQREIEVIKARRSSAMDERIACQLEIERLIETGILIHRDAIKRLVEAARVLEAAAIATGPDSDKQDWVDLYEAASNVRAALMEAACKP